MPAPRLRSRATATPGTLLVTGAARGIGRAIGELFLSRGWRVGLYDVDADAVAAVAAGRPNAVHGRLDVRDPQQWEATLAGLCGDGALDVLVNNAGVLVSGAFADSGADTHRWLVEVNVVGVLNGCAAARPYLLRSGRALLLNIGSASALYGQPSLATYGATKAAVRSLTEALDLEWGRDGIRVRSLMPLFVATPMADAAGAAPSVGRLGVRLSAEDVAAAAWRAVHERRVPLRAPHRVVGAQTRLFATLAAVSPAWANRLVVRAAAAG